MFTAASSAAPVPKKLAIVKLAFSQSEDGEVVSSKYQFLGGEVLYFSCQVEGYSKTEKDEIRLTFQIEAKDASGVLLQAPAHLQLARSQESGKAPRPSRAPSFLVFHSFPFLLAPTLCLVFSSSGTLRKTSTGNLIVSENLGIIGKPAPYLQDVPIC